MSISSRRTLGSSLNDVLGAVNTSVEELNSHRKNEQELMQVMVHQVVPGKFQPRRKFDPASLQELSDSIVAKGILQPIVVRISGVNEYEIIAGERRWRAAQMAGLQRVPVITCNITDESALAYALIENIQRQDLNPIEEAFALKRLIEEFKMTHEKIAQSIGRSRTMVSNTLRLLNLTPLVQEFLITKKLDVGHVKVLLVFSPEEQEEIALTIIERKLTVRAAERLTQARKAGLTTNIEIIKPHAKCAEWSRALTGKLVSKVQVKLNETGSGTVIIHIDSENEVEWLIEKF